MVDVRKGQGDVKLTREEFERRLRERFYDPAFQNVERQMPRSSTSPGTPTTSTARVRARGRRAPASPIPSSSCRSSGSRRASGFNRPSANRGCDAVPAVCLLVCGAARHDQTCPGEMSKTFRLASQAREEIERAGLQCDLLDLSLLTAQYGRQILPCKACVSTAMPLCHWPCSCYPNHAWGRWSTG